MHHGTLKQRLGNLNEVEVWNLIIKYLRILNFCVILSYKQTVIFFYNAQGLRREDFGNF